MENVITLGKSIDLLCLFCPPLPSVFENSINFKNELAHPVMGTIFLVYVHTKISRNEFARPVMETFS